MFGKTLYRSRAAGLVVAVLGCLASPGLADAAAKPAKTEVTIGFVEDGELAGYVNSKVNGCTGKRQVVVYRQQGRKQNPRSDERVGSDRSDSWERGHRWSVAEPQPGSFYAVAERRRGCAAGRSETVRTPPVGFGAGGGIGERTDFPPCGPYVSEGTSDVCRLDQLHLTLDWDQSCRFFTFASSDCRGTTTAGQFPWGETGEAARPPIWIGWRPDGDRRIISFSAYRHRWSEPPPIATLEGSVPGSGSPRFSISDAYAQSDRGYPTGDHFYTPDLPGQGPGEPGGPLAINWQAKTGGYAGEVDIYGYLYLKR